MGGNVIRKSFLKAIFSIRQKILSHNLSQKVGNLPKTQSGKIDLFSEYNFFRGMEIAVSTIADFEIPIPCIIHVL